jgi:hypothetical protein
MGSASRSGGLARGETEAGYSAALARSVLKAEKEIKDNKYETAVIFDENGKEVFRKEGTRAGVSYPGKYDTDRIMTHNHPGPDSTFSSADLAGAVEFNAKEVRAVSRNFTFSMKRPAGGWGSVKPEAVKRSYNTIRRQVMKEWEPKFAKAASGAPMRKTYIQSQIEVQSRIAKKYGWSFSYKKNS